MWRAPQDPLSSMCLPGSQEKALRPRLPRLPTLNGACTGTVAIPTSSCLKSVTFSATATDTLSSPWVDYATDKAFVGSDDGKIYRISCVFNCALNTHPAVDWTFTLPVAGTGGAAATPNGPVYDSSDWALDRGRSIGRAVDHQCQRSDA